VSGDAAKSIPACVACHGAALIGVAPAIPGLLGLPRSYISAQFGAWRNGSRHAEAPDCMADISQRLSIEDINAAATWLAAQPVQTDALPAQSLPDPMPIRCGSVARSGEAR
jgi:cytochrome c553